MSSIEQSCFWLASREESPPDPPLVADRRADIAIIGSGFTGLWTALFIKTMQPDTDVVVLEQGIAGYGGSGRNAGIVSACIDHSHALAITHFGPDEAQRLARVGADNFEELAAFAADCDFERTGQLQMALSPAHLDDCARSLEVAAALGLDGYRILSGEEARQEINSPLYLGAVESSRSGIVNPVKLVYKLKREASALGVKFYERTRVSGFDGDTVRTANGAVTAGKIVLATDSYTHLLAPNLLWRYIPLYDYILVSEPLTQAQRSTIGWRKRQGVIDGRAFFNYYRLTADERILWGTSEAMYYSPNRVDESCDHSERHYKTLRESFNRHFPQLADVSFPYAWGGPIASTTRLTPFFGGLAGGRIVYGLGYTGHGIGSTRLAGKILASMALSRPSELLKLKLVTDKPFPYPPEPVRSFAVRQVTSSLQKVDAGGKPSFFLRMLDAFGLGFSS